MKYVNSSLMSDEKLIFFTRPHKAIFIPIFIWLAVILLIFIMIPKWGINIPLLDRPLRIPLSLPVFLVAIFHAISIYITYIASEYAITDKRVLMKVGFIRRSSMEIFLDKIESIHVTQSILGRILDFGSIIISGTGGSKDPFNYIPSPMQFRKQVQEQIEKLMK